ncbi:hypothetical protein MCOR28_008321 [Pyricularia oryzae]|nr:hypothetical protein MCOR28_008321 [Pyricularia oryzae]KAI6386760.1 hypothetical protein MCOR32_000821 [Pyricularia oryzae]KAI6552909.1 hypothetical protein MCOR09_010739 [Pyricularia oryzae]
MLQVSYPPTPHKASALAKHTGLSVVSSALSPLQSGRREHGNPDPVPFHRRQAKREKAFQNLIGLDIPRSSLTWQAPTIRATTSVTTTHILTDRTTATSMTRTELHVHRKPAAVSGKGEGGSSHRNGGLHKERGTRSFFTQFPSLWSSREPLIILVGVICLLNMAPSFFASILPTAVALLVALGGADAQSSTSGRFTWVQPADTVILGQYGHSPAVYPSPNITGAGGWENALQKARDFVSQLTVEEKAVLVTGSAGPCVGNIAGIPRLGFNGLCLQDGPLAIRMADYASVFSAGVSIAATWDKKMMYDRGVAMGKEFKAKGAHIALTPVAGPLGRSAYAGRNWEGFSADPYLTGIGMETSVRGLQDAGVQATAKHWIGNEQEIMRNPVFNPNGTLTDVDFEAISANIDDRTMHEVYMFPFANSVKAGVAAMMCSYQRLNGSYACQNSKSTNGLLKGELGFEGYVMSDWGAVHSGVASIEAGLDMNMPGGLGAYGFTFGEGSGSFFGGNITRGVNNGTIETGRLDDMILRIMTPYYWLGQDKDYPLVDPSSSYFLEQTLFPKKLWNQNVDMLVGGEASRDVREKTTAKLIREHGAAAAVLLKNVNKALPLKSAKSVAIFGNDAGDPTQGYYNQPNYEYGTLTAGGGSGTGRLTSIVTPLDAIKNRVAQDNGIVQAWLNNTLIATTDIRSLWLPKLPDVCIVMLKTWAEEADDRHDLNVNWRGNEVVESVASQCNNTVVVTHSSGINDLPWADHPNVTAILAAHYPGEQSGNSLVDLLWGDVSPSGKLPYTIALKPGDYNAPPTTNITTNGKEDWQSYFEEKLEVDYKYFDAHNMSVRYEFGFGLSYTTFALADAKVSQVAEEVAARAPAASDGPHPGGNPALWDTVYRVSVSLSNTGDVAGAAVPQLYVRMPGAPAGTPPRQLRGFERVQLAVGETKTVDFDLMRRDISYWDVVLQDWIIPSGELGFDVGFSSRDIKVSASAKPVA